MSQTNAMRVSWMRDPASVITSVGVQWYRYEDDRRSPILNATSTVLLLTADEYSTTIEVMNSPRPNFSSILFF